MRLSLLAGYVEYQSNAVLQVKISYNNLGEFLRNTNKIRLFKRKLEANESEIKRRIILRHYLLSCNIWLIK